MSLSQIKQQIASLLETEPSKVTVKLTNKSEDSQYDPIIALHSLLPIIEESDPVMASKLSEIVFEDLRNNGINTQNNFTIVISEEAQSVKIKNVSELPSVFRSGRKIDSEKIKETIN